MTRVSVLRTGNRTTLSPAASNTHTLLRPGAGNRSIASYQSGIIGVGDYPVKRKQLRVYSPQKVFEGSSDEEVPENTEEGGKDYNVVNIDVESMINLPLFLYVIMALCGYMNGSTMSFIAKLIYETYHIAPAYIQVFRAIFQLFFAFCLTSVTDQLDGLNILRYPLKIRIILFSRNLLGSVAMLFFYYSMKDISQFEAVVILSTSTVYAMVIGVLFLGEKFHGIDVIVFVVTMAAIVLIVTAPAESQDVSVYTVVPANTSSNSSSTLEQNNVPRNHARGVIMAIATSIFLALILVFTRMLAVVNPIVQSCFNSLMLLFISVSFAMIVEGEIPTFPSWQCRLSIVAMAVGGITATIVMSLSLKHMPAHVMALIKNMDTVQAMAWDFVIFRTLPHPRGCIGAILIMVGVAILSAKYSIINLVQKIPVRNKCVKFLFKYL